MKSSTYLNAEIIVATRRAKKTLDSKHNIAANDDGITDEEQSGSRDRQEYKDTKRRHNEVRKADWSYISGVHRRTRRGVRGGS